MSDKRGDADALDAEGAVERMRQLWRSVMGYPVAAMTHEGVWHPPVDVYETDEAVVVEIELPGMKGQKMDVSIDGDHLIVEGVRGRTGEGVESEPYYAERAFGKFHRIVHLPAHVDPERTSASYNDGVLTVTSPKLEKDKAWKIKVS